MKPVYVIHSKDFDFKKELYVPLRKSALNSKFNFVLPHEHSDELFDSKNFFQDKRPIVIVEASFPKIGIGIEVGWANAYGLCIVSMVKKGYRLSPGLKSVCNYSFEYDNEEDMISKLGSALEKFI